jgi:hypothetical protein
MKVHGRCHCGSIAYEAEIDPARVSACHCSDCQMLTGSAFRVSVPAPRESFKLTGQPSTYVKVADSGNKRVHAFCAECGAPVYSSAIADPPTYSLRVGCLDERAHLPPRKQIWCKSAMPWAMDLHDIPEVARQ